MNIKQLIYNAHFLSGKLLWENKISNNFLEKFNE